MHTAIQAKSRERGARRRVRFYLQEPEVSPRLGPKRAQGYETDRSTEATELSREERTPSPKRGYVYILKSLV